jgi:predicted DCC family thiol-disulfide oxidoreductase YuxK
MSHAIVYGRHYADQILSQKKAVEDQIFEEGRRFGRAELEGEQALANDHDRETDLTDQHAADMAQRAAEIAESISGLWLAVKEMQRLTRSLDHRGHEYIAACTTIVRCLTAIDVLEGLGK